jgi:hypothetical protein
MADNSRYASRRSDDYQAPAGASPTANDPLAELARLIGREDPFAELRRQTASARARGEPLAPARRDTPAPDWLGGPRAAPPAARPDYVAAGNGPVDPRADASDAAHWRASRYRDQPIHDEAEADYQQAHYPQAHDPQPSHYADESAADYRHDQSEQQQHALPHQDGYRDEPPVAGDYESETDYADDHGVPEDGYEAPRERRRGGWTTIAAVVGIVVLLVGGAFGYRALSGRLGSGQPPVISADSSPSKVVPAQAEAQPNKLSYDRAADKGTGAEVVSREEQPVDVSKVAPRQIAPWAPTPVTNSTPSAPTAGAPAAGAEPKKVRTLTIRPDQPASAESTDTATPWPAPPPTRSVAPATVPAQPTARAAPRPTPAPPATTLGTASASADMTTEHPTRTAAVAPAAQPIRAPEAGGYVVQLFSGRSETEAQDQFRALQAKYQGVLGDRQPIIRRADLGEKGVYYRAQVGPFRSIDQANQFCGSLKSAGGQCIVQRN